MLSFQNQQNVYQLLFLSLPVITVTAVRPKVVEHLTIPAGILEKFHAISTCVQVVNFNPEKVIINRSRYEMISEQKTEYCLS